MFLSVVFLQNEVGQSRLGIIVGKRFVHRAVDRNRIRKLFGMHQVLFFFMILCLLFEVPMWLRCRMMNFVV